MRTVYLARYLNPCGCVKNLEEATRSRELDGLIVRDKLANGYPYWCSWCQW